MIRCVEDESIHLKVEYPSDYDYIFIQDLDNDDRNVAVPRDKESIDKLIKLLEEVKELI